MFLPQDTSEVSLWGPGEPVSPSDFNPRRRVTSPGHTNGETEPLGLNTNTDDLASSVPSVNQELAERRSRRARDLQLEMERQGDGFYEAQRWWLKQSQETAERQRAEAERQLASMRRLRAQMQHLSMSLGLYPNTLQQLRQTNEPEEISEQERAEAEQQLAAERRETEPRRQRLSNLLGLHPNTLLQLRSIQLRGRQRQADLLQDSEQLQSRSNERQELQRRGELLNRRFLLERRAREFLELILIVSVGPVVIMFVLFLFFRNLSREIREFNRFDMGRRGME